MGLITGLLLQIALTEYTENDEVSEDEIYEVMTYYAAFSLILVSVITNSQMDAVRYLLV